MKQPAVEKTASLSATSAPAVIALCLGCSGCTLIGMGIGSTVPVYERASPAWKVEDSPAGSQVRIRTEDGRTIEGTVESQPEPLVVRDSDTGKLATLDPASVWVGEKKVGSEWATGAFIGALVDITVVIVGGVILSSQFKMNSNMNFGPITY